MASTFAELFSDFQDQVKIYTEKLDLTEFAFMRLFTKAMQVFQRETEYVQKYVDVPYNVTDEVFYVPDDMLRPIEVKDVDGYTFVWQEYTQYTRNLELYADGYIDTPVNYTIRMPQYRNGNLARYITQYNRQFHIYPENRYTGTADDTLYLWYIPDLHPISQNSSQWNYNDTLGNPAGWFPHDTRFDMMFRTTSVNNSLAPYEDAFLNHAIAMFIRSQGSANYRVFEKTFWDEVERAKWNKPVLFREAVRPYYLAPYNG